MEASDETVAGLLLNIRDRVRLVEQMFLKIASISQWNVLSSTTTEITEIFKFWFYN